MGPIRGLRKRKKTEKKPEENASGSGSSEKEGSVDWWDEFMKRISGMFFFDILIALPYLLSFLLVFIFFCYILDVVVVVEQSHSVWVCRFLSLLIEFCLIG